MRLLMVSGDRQVAIGERGPFYSMQREFSRYFERIDVICPRPPGEVTIRSIWDNVHFHPATVDRTDMVGYIVRRGGELIDQHQHSLIVSHDYGWFYNGLGSGALSRAHGIPYISEIHHVPGVPVAANMRERFDKWVARMSADQAAARLVRGIERNRRRLLIGADAHISDLAARISPRGWQWLMGIDLRAAVVAREEAQQHSKPS